MLKITLESLGYIKHSKYPLLYTHPKQNISILITDVDVEKRYMTSVLPLTHGELLACARIVAERKGLI